MNSAIATRAVGAAARTVRALGSSKKLVVRAPVASTASQQRLNASARFRSTSAFRSAQRFSVSASANRFHAMTATVEKEKAAPKPIFLKDYQQPAYWVNDVHLDFNLGEEETVVKATVKLTPNNANNRPLDLDGSPEVVLRDVSIDGKKLAESGYKRTEKGGLQILSPPQVPYTLEITTVIQPQNNTSLEGLYKSSGNFCTQCEAEGFRRITFYPDRPDVMAKFVTRIEADEKSCPVLLGNGNLVSQGKLDGGRHFTVWEDPFPKPCYLFALVAGDLAHIEDTFTTSSGRKVTLRIYVQAHNISKCGFAMESLIKSMKWDEDTFGLEYDLDLFNIVAVDDFNMGAMENKSLNIFNSRLVLATPETATDADYAAIEAVVGHEYFHNWTGNRVTCRDWFQLSLKEGLTVYRDQEFSADLNSRGVKRISDVSRLRAAQFPQDAGPMAHPVQPDSYIKMDNFYSVTVYEKGAEVVRLYRTALGVDGFRKGMDLYFKRHDGQAVTVYDFLSAMEDANGADLSGIKPWYTQAGTPKLTVRTSYDAAAKTFTLECSQATPATPGQPTKVPALIPIAVGLLGPDGKDMPLQLQGEAAGTATTKVLNLKEATGKFTFVNVASKPVPSILRGFSAPVVLDAGLSEEDLVFLFANDSDDFNRWEAGQQLLRSLALRLLDAHGKGQPLAMPASVTEAMRAVLKRAAAPGADGAFAARALALPGEGEISELVPVSDPDAIHAVRQFMLKSLAAAMRPELEAALAANTDAKYSNSKEARARRSLKNTCLGYLSVLGDAAVDQEALRRFRTADNMTDQLAALAALNNRDCPERAQALGEFYERFKEDYLVMNKWLGLQAMSDLPGNVKRVRELMEHPAFDIRNPNKVYALVGGFAGCPVNFHAKDGSGYEFLGDAVMQLDKLNAQVAARMVSGFTRWKKYDEGRQKLMRAQLERIVAGKPSDNVYEIASKSLAA